jgi:hypothetical protein
MSLLRIPERSPPRSLHLLEYPTKFRIVVHPQGTPLALAEITVNCRTMLRGLDGTEVTETLLRGVSSSKVSENESFLTEDEARNARARYIASSKYSGVSCVIDRNRRQHCNEILSFGHEFILTVSGGTRSDDFIQDRRSLS